MTKINTEKELISSSYYYLWHLVSLGVITPDETGEGFSKTLWDTLSDKGEVCPARVVMIDVGCNFEHPNLKDRVDPVQSVDFTASPYGSRLKAAASDVSQRNFSGLKTDRLVLDGLLADDAALFRDIVLQLESSTGQLRANGDVEALFASHGTAVSGLIVGGPENCAAGQEPSKGVIPYFGVDPFSQLVSIRTGFDDDPLQFLSALLYAWHQNPDVIVMPRGIPDPDRELSSKDDFKANLESWANHEAADLFDRIQEMEKTAEATDPGAPQSSATGRRLWRIVEALFVAISKHVPIVCAAGNEGESQLLYPANLANRENGIIAVGAVSGEGYRSGYSNYGDGLTLVAPSDDMVVFNRHQLRDTKRNADRLRYLMPEEASENPFSRMWLLTTDIGGQFGYEIGQVAEDDVEGDIPKSGYYTHFGGTSGACALVGGVVALIRRAERLAGKSSDVADGRDLKELLAATARRDICVGKECRKLQTDSMNAAGEDATPFELFFGAGLVDAKAAVETVLSYPRK